MLEIGKMKPDNSITGSINPIKEIIMAVCCVAEIVEIKIPKARALIINRILSKANKNKLPCTGMLKINMLNTTIIMALTIERKIYGNTFPIITWNGFKIKKIKNLKEKSKT